ncbi:MAG: GNAT family N-acetyltransferase [Thermomicrobiales bacterium]
MSDQAAGDQTQAEADFALALQRVDALFTRDRQGDLLTLNELEPVPPPTPAPRIYLGVTAGGVVRAYRQDVPVALRGAIDHVCEEVAPLAHVRDRLLPSLQAVLAAHSPASVWDISTGPAYDFPGALRRSAEITAIEPGQESLLAAHFPFTAAWLRERWPCFAIIHDGRAVSICYSARRTEAVAEAGVDTAEAFRGRGYAALVTAAWATAIRAAGITPVYSTSDENLASQAVARKLGLRQFAWDVQMS